MRADRAYPCLAPNRTGLIGKGFMTRLRILIVGGVAGGASCAARVRRLNEEAEIIIFERGPYVSFANCGLPYYLGGVIQEEGRLLVSSADLFKTHFNIEVRTENEVIAIDRNRSEIEVRRLATGQVYREHYDALVLAPGAAPIRPPVPGVDLPGIFVMRSIPDAREIKRWIKQRNAKSAVVVGAGFIGLEAAENLSRLGIRVTILEMLDQVMPPLDPEMAALVERCLVENGVGVHLNSKVNGFERTSDGALLVRTLSGHAHRADLILLAAGVRPETDLARAAGLALGAKGSIKVDQSMRTSDPQIWAVGDAVENRDLITGGSCVVPLAGPANRQGRVAAESICGRPSQFRCVQATAVCGAFGLIIASTGASEKTLRRSGIDNYEKVHLHPNNHAGYYPNPKPIHLKLLFSPLDGRVLGAQAIGGEGTDKRIDVIAMAVQMHGTVFDLEEAELCYAPQFGSAKDPVNMAGMIAANVIRGDLIAAQWEDPPSSNALLVDVREPDEFAAGHVEGSINLPLSQLRQRIRELPKDREITVYCRVGQRSYYAMRILAQHGYRVSSLSGGITSYSCLPSRPKIWETATIH